MLLMHGDIDGTPMPSTVIDAANAFRSCPARHPVTAAPGKAHMAMQQGANSTVDSSVPLLSPSAASIIVLSTGRISQHN